MKRLDPVAAAPAAETYPILPAPWWTSPAGLAIGFLMPMFGLVSSAVQFDLAGLTARGIQFINSYYLMLGLAMMFVMAVGGWIGQVITPHTRPQSNARQGDVAALWIGIIATVAYVIWFREYLINPVLLVSILTGASMPDRTEGATMTGITSLVNMAPVFFSIYGWRRVYRPNIPLAPWMTPMMVLLSGLTAFRVYAWSERLAMIEAVLPVALMMSIKLLQSRSPVVRLLVNLGPFVALPLLMAYFGLAESVRSWTSDTYNGKIGFFDFVVGRMATYYYTALNNGCGVLAMFPWPDHTYHFVASSLYTAPLGIGQVFTAFTGSPESVTDAFLGKFADPEFNSIAGLYTVIFDLGLPLGIAYFATVGFISGWVFRRFADGYLGGALWYPMFFIQYLEIFRYPYLGTGRAFAWAVGLIFVALIVRRSKPRAAEPAPLTPLEERAAGANAGAGAGSVLAGRLER